MEIVNRVAAKNIFFNKLPLIVGVPKVDFYLEVTLNKVHDKPNISNTMRFNSLTTFVLNEAKQQFPNDTIKIGDIVYAKDFATAR